MADLVLSPLLKKLADVISEYSKDQAKWQKGMKKEQKKLRKIHPQIQAVVSAYNRGQIESPGLNEWYWQLRDAVDETDDVLDEIEYRKLEEQASKSKKTGKVRFRIKSIKKRVVKIAKRAVHIDPYLKKLEVALRNLNEISATVSTFLSLLQGAELRQERQQLRLHRAREAGSTLGDDFVGRSNEITRVKDWLSKPPHGQVTDPDDLYSNISLLSVVGDGGMGKTTLLQRVYQDVALNKDGATEGFDVKIWVCVSTNSDATTVIKNIFQSLGKVSRYESLEALQNDLKSELMPAIQSEIKPKRFLLVLDDIWEEDERCWKNVLTPLRFGSPGSKILITTRMNSVALMFAKVIKKGNEKLPLEGLEENELLKLFNAHAFAGVENPDHDEFRSIAKKIVKNLLGCPLAAKLIGDVLNSDMDMIFWTNVLNTSIGNVKPLKSGQNDLFPILKLSYMHLPDHLRKCFSFCCMFPQDYRFVKDDLVRMWIALGFIQSSDIQGEILEDTGKRYFNFLVQRSFFDELPASYEKVYYKMHDLLHELAQLVSAKECFRVVNDKSIPPDTVRHLSIHTRSPEEAFKNMERFKNLRSLFLSYGVNFDGNLTDELSKIFKASKSIRLLAITALNLSKIPETINRLIHLRYLNVECHAGPELPRSISHLYHLQFIISDKLPNLEMGNVGWKELMPNENCQLILDKLVIKDPSATQLTIEPLRSITSFRSLKIENNEELVSFESETEQWLLQQSSSLIELVFDKLHSLKSLPSSLESLSSLKILEVNNVPHLELLPNPPASLTSLILDNLESLQRLPSSLSAISSLDNLSLRSIPLLRSLPDLPSSLIYLTIGELLSLQRLPSSLSTLSSLKSLQLRNIPQLKSLPDLPYSLPSQRPSSSSSTFSSLLKIQLKNIPLLKLLPDLPSSLEWLELEELNSLRSLPSSLTAISSLHSLKLKNIPLLESLPDLPSSLEWLVLQELESLRYLPSSLFAISSLRNLELKNIPLLESLPDLPSSLKHLKIKKLKSLQSLPSCLSALSSLEYLKLKHIPLLQSLPDLPSSLIFLMIESLQCLPSSFSTLSSLESLKLRNIPILESLPDLPSSLEDLQLEELKALRSLPSSLSTLSSLESLKLKNIPLLETLPDLPESLKIRDIEDCQLQLMERYENFDRTWD